MNHESMAGAVAVLFFLFVWVVPVIVDFIVEQVKARREHHIKLARIAAGFDVVETRKDEDED